MPFPVLSDEGWKKAQPFRHDLLNWGRKGGVVIPSDIGQAIGIGKEDRLSYGSGISTVRAENADRGTQEAPGKAVLKLI